MCWNAQCVFNQSICPHQCKNFRPLLTQIVMNSYDMILCMSSNIVFSTTSILTRWRNMFKHSLYIDSLWAECQEFPGACCTIVGRDNIFKFIYINDCKINFKNSRGIDTNPYFSVNLSHSAYLLKMEERRVPTFIFFDLASIWRMCSSSFVNLIVFKTDLLSLDLIQNCSTLWTNIRFVKQSVHHFYKLLFTSIIEYCIY